MELEVRVAKYQKIKPYLTRENYFLQTKKINLADVNSVDDYVSLILKYLEAQNKRKFSFLSRSFLIDSDSQRPIMEGIREKLKFSISSKYSNRKFLDESFLHLFSQGIIEFQSIGNLSFEKVISSKWVSIFVRSFFIAKKDLEKDDLFFVPITESKEEAYINEENELRMNLKTSYKKLFDFGEPKRIEEKNKDLKFLGIFPVSTEMIYNPLPLNLVNWELLKVANINIYSSLSNVF